MKMMSNEDIDGCFSAIGEDTQLSGQIIPWTWLGDNLIRMLPDGHHHDWQNKHMVGYCQPFKRPIQLEEDGEQYWPYFVAYYGDYKNQAIETTNISYGIYLEGEYEHFYVDLTGWSISRDLRSGELFAGETTGIVDFEGNVFFSRYQDVKRLLGIFSEQMMRREQLRGDPYLACLATHHYQDIYLGCNTGKHIQQMNLPVYRPLKQLVWGV